LEREMQSPAALQVTFCQIRHVTDSCGASPFELVLECLLIIRCDE
jgi:hypothetical protein